MQDFYSTWLKQSESIEKTVSDAPRVAKGKNLNWMRTRQDSKAALMIAPELGFPTGDSLLMRAEIPPGMMHHQHFNPNDTDMKELRFEFGIRYWLADQWKGYTTIDRHMKATHMDD